MKRIVLLYEFTVTACRKLGTTFKRLYLLLKRPHKQNSISMSLALAAHLRAGFRASPFAALASHLTLRVFPFLVAAARLLFEHFRNEYGLVSCLTRELAC